MPAPLPTARHATTDAPGDLARQALLSRHLGLVHHVARQLGARLQGEVELDELVSAGTLGLIHAMDAFDPSRGHSFSTFAVPRIRGAILDELRRLDRVPRSVRRRSRDIAQARAELQRDHGREPTAVEVASRLGVPADVLRKWEHALEGGVHVSLDQASDEGPGRAPLPRELLADADRPGVDDRLTLEHEVLQLHAALQDLSPQERNVLALSYFEGLKLQEIGDVLGLSACRISQIRTAALMRLRARLSRLRAA